MQEKEITATKALENKSPGDNLKRKGILGAQKVAWYVTGQIDQE